MVFKGSVSKCKHARLKFQKYGEENSFFSKYFFHVDARKCKQKYHRRSKGFMCLHFRLISCTLQFKKYPKILS